jgi:hypothetical protein
MGGEEKKEEERRGEESVGKLIPLESAGRKCRKSRLCMLGRDGGRREPTRRHSRKEHPGQATITQNRTR